MFALAEFIDIFKFDRFFKGLQTHLIPLKRI